MKGLGAAASAAVIILSGGAAYAADLNALPVKALPVATPGVCTTILDFFSTACQVAAYGVRFYGTIDVSFGYQTNGEAIGKTVSSGYNYYPQKQNFGGKWALTPNTLSQSNVGFEIKEPLGGGWSFVGQIEAAFDPATFELINGGKSLKDDVGHTLLGAPSSADSSLNGTAWNSLGFFGFSNDTWGTLTFLRQRNLYTDIAASYDAIPGSYAFSLLGGTGSLPGGGGTEQGRQTTAIKYRVNVANWRFGVFGQAGDYDVGNSTKGQIQGQVGFDYRLGAGLLSVDAAGGYSKDAVNETVGFGVLGNGLGDPNSTAGTVTATISNNTSAIVGAKYTIDRLKLYAGYEWIQLAAPSDTITSFTDINGYQFGPGIPGTKVTSFGSIDKVLQFAWVGARYSVTDSVDVAAAYYHLSQNDFSGGLGSTSAGNLKQTCAQSATAMSSCSGTQDAVSALIDWKFAPKWDTYLGTSYTKLKGGLDNGFLADSNWTTTAGIRFRW
jgi:predicted porin